MQELARSLAGRHYAQAAVLGILQQSGCGKEHRSLHRHGLAEDVIKHALGAAARPFPSAVIAIGCGCLIDHRTIRKTWAGFRRDAGVVFMPCRFNAFITAIRASISGPSHSATSNSVSIAICQSAAACSAFGKLVMYSAASRSVSNLRPSGSTI